MVKRIQMTAWAPYGIDSVRSRLWSFNVCAIGKKLMTESTSPKFVPVEQYQALEDMIEDLRDIIAAKDARSAP